MEAEMKLAESYWAADNSEKMLDLTLGDLLRQVASEVPDRTALVEGTPDPATRRRWTYREFLSAAEQVAQSLLGRFAPGEHVAVWAPNCAEWILLQHGASLAGLVLVTVNPAYLAEELEHVLKASKVRGIFFTDVYRSNNMKAILESVRPRLPELREAVSFSDWGRFIQEGKSDVELPLVSPSDMVQIQFTSGTTGLPKGACLHHRGIINASRFLALRAGFPDGGVWVNAMPLFHVGGCAVSEIGTLAQRGTFVLMTAFDAAAMLEIFESERGNITLVVPTMLIAMLDHPDRQRRDLSSLRAVMSGATAVPAALVRRATQTLGCKFTMLFGQTELNGVITQTHLDDTPEDQAETVGRPLPRMEVKIADPQTGDVLPLDTPGEICARGYQTMKGYFEMPAESSATLRDDGWLHTGDLGSMDQRGYVRITGRLKDMIIRGGENIYPREIEEILFEHPGVSMASVVGMPDQKWGEVVAAVIRAASPQDPPTVMELHAYCRSRLAAYKTPSVWFFINDFPMTASGKIRKHILRDDLLKSGIKGFVKDESNTNRSSSGQSVQDPGGIRHPE